ncbi:MAG TPA: phosphatidylinositol-specific phospholipase C1-like protein, partial [Acidimicrobiales bacterium]
GVIGAADDQLEYRHAPLPTQFQDQKVRQIELDAWVDSSGGLYANPLIRQITGGGSYDPVMKKPGFKVFHVQDVDYHSSCLTLVRCLTEVKDWSDAHPSHVPIAILVELKDEPLVIPGYTFATPEPWTTAAMDQLDATIKSVLPADKLITPDDVRGSAATLRDAVTTTGWPTLTDSRGKVMFIMDNASFRSDYLVGHPDLQGRVLFTNASPSDDDAAFIEMNDPSDPSIKTLVKEGFVVRTRADGDTVEARANDTTHRDEALASGAQWVSTDYPVPHWGIGFDNSYFAEIPGGVVARCNPVNAPPACVSAALDTNYTAPVTPTTEPPTTVNVGTTVVTPTTAADNTAPGATPVAGTSSFTG